MKIDLGYKYPASMAGVAPAAPQREERTIYPSFAICNKPEVLSAEIGDEMEVKAKVRVTGKREQAKESYPGDDKCRLEVDVLEIDMPGAKKMDMKEEKPDFSALRPDEEE